jgi:hypothetical protein
MDIRNVVMFYLIELLLTFKIIKYFGKTQKVPSFLPLKNFFDR